MYEKFYRFSAQPFSLSPDPKFLYLARSHFEAFSTMMSGIKERKGIIVITGEVGIGKTILIYALLKDLDEKIKTAFIFNPRLSFKDLLKAILVDLEAPVAEKEENLFVLLVQFRKYLQERLTRDETVAIVIDEAQGLDDEALRGLTSLPSQDSPSAKLLQILLVGQPELEVRLNSEKLRPVKEKIAVHRQIRPLPREEGRGYIEHRVRAAGRNISEVFASEAVNRIWEFAEGIPRVMNLLCDRALSIGFKNSSPMIDFKIVKAAIKELDYLRSPQSRIFGPFFPQLNFQYKILGVLILLFLGVGIFASLFPHYRFLPWKITSKNVPSAERAGKKQGIRQDSGPSSFEKKGEIHSTEKRGGEKPKEGIIPAPKGIVPPEKQLPEREKKELVEVKKGWNLSLVARQNYPVVNTSLLDFILDANPQITDIDLIFPDQKIRIPNITEESLLIQISDNHYNIYLGTFQRAQDVRLYKEEPSLRKKKWEVVSRQVSPRETWYRIVVGEFDTKEEALKSIQILKEKKMLPLLDCLPRKRL